MPWRRRCEPTPNGWAELPLRSSRKSEPIRAMSRSGRPPGVVFISSFKKDGLEVGFSQWWPEEQAFAWSFPGLTEGYIDAARLQPSGGWSFTPDMAWLNTQNLALHEFHTAVRTRGTGVAEAGRLVAQDRRLRRADVARERSRDATISIGSIRSIFRPCCDGHDRCYEKAGSGLRGEQLVDVVVELAVHSVQHVGGFLLQDRRGRPCPLPSSVKLRSSLLGVLAIVALQAMGGWWLDSGQRVLRACVVLFALGVFDWSVAIGRSLGSRLRLVGRRDRRVDRRLVLDRARKSLAHRPGLRGCDQRRRRIRLERSSDWG